MYSLFEILAHSMIWNLLISMVKIACRNKEYSDSVVLTCQVLSGPWIHGEVDLEPFGLVHRGRPSVVVLCHAMPSLRWCDADGNAASAVWLASERVSNRSF